MLQGREEESRVVVRRRAPLVRLPIARKDGGRDRVVPETLDVVQQERHLLVPARSEGKEPENVHKQSYGLV